jgi:hypothetical protein
VPAMVRATGRRVLTAADLCELVTLNALWGL